VDETWFTRTVAKRTVPVTYPSEAEQPHARHAAQAHGSGGIGVVVPASALAATMIARPSDERPRAGGAPATVAATDRPKPNFVFVLTDDLSRNLSRRGLLPGR